MWKELFLYKYRSQTSRAESKSSIGVNINFDPLSLFPYIEHTVQQMDHMDVSTLLVGWGGVLEEERAWLQRFRAFDFQI